MEGENYVIRSESTDFTNRQKSIFDQLDAIKVANHSETNLNKGQAKKFLKTVGGRVAVDVDSDHKGKKIDFKHFKGKESIFKRPEPPPPPRKSRPVIPDFQRNPHKWKKYSLNDVSEDDMSDKSNTAAAMAFLNEIKSRKGLEDDPMETDEKIVFKQPSRPNISGSQSRIIKISKDDSPGEDGTSYFRGSKLVMPEYVIGEKKKPTKQKKEDCSADTKQDKTAKIKLNHLTFNDGEEDDEENT